MDECDNHIRRLAVHGVGRGTHVNHMVEMQLTSHARD